MSWKSLHQAGQSDPLVTILLSSVKKTLCFGICNLLLSSVFLAGQVLQFELTETMGGSQFVQLGPKSIYCLPLHQFQPTVVLGIAVWFLKSQLEHLKSSIEYYQVSTTPTTLGAMLLISKDRYSGVGVGRLL